MKILIFEWRDIKNPKAGGSELYFHELAKRWVGQGNKVTIICGGWEGCNKEEVIEGIKTIRIEKEFSQYLLSPFAYFKLKEKPNIIIDVENGIPFFIPLFSKPTKILHIHHIHKNVWFKETWNGGLKNKVIALIGYFLETKVMPFVYRNTKIVTVSESSNEEIKRLFKKEAEIVYNGVDTNKFKPDEKSKTPEIIFVGRLKKYKSVDVLLKAISSLKNEKIKVYIIGRGDDEERLKKLRKNLNLKHVIFKGFVSENEKIKHLQRAWLAINPSMIEGWSITNIEANACGTPVIGSNVPGIKDSVIDRKTGLLFKYGDEKELAEKIDFLIKNKKIRENMGKEAIKWAKNFSWDKSAEKYLDIIKKVTKQ